MKLTLMPPNDWPPPIPVRLVETQSYAGIKLEAYYEGSWISICTLRSDGTLYLFDIKHTPLKDKFKYIVNGTILIQSANNVL